MVDLRDIIRIVQEKRRRYVSVLRRSRCRKSGEERSVFICYTFLQLIVEDYAIQQSATLGNSLFRRTHSNTQVFRYNLLQ